MSSFRFLHAADIHLDSPLSGLSRYDSLPQDEIRHASRRALEKLVSLAIDEKVAFVLLSGDLYDGPLQDTYTGFFMVRMLTQLTKAGIKVFSLSGNHDAASIVKKQFPMPEGVYHFSDKKAETILLEEWKVAVHGRSFPDRRVPEDLSATYPRPQSGYLNIGLLHTSLEGASDGHECYAPCTLDGLNTKEYDYWALGHVHTAKIIQESPSWVVYPGVLQGRHIRETGACGAMLVDVEDGHITHVQRAHCDVLRWQPITVDLTKVEEFSELEDLVKNALTHAFNNTPNSSLVVRLTLTGETSLHGFLWHGSEWQDSLRVFTEHLSDSVYFLGIEKICTTTTEPKRNITLYTEALEQSFQDAIASLTSSSEKDTEFNDFLNRLPDDMKSAFPEKLDQETLENARSALTYRLKGESIS